jgi:hypothetical protein
MRIIFVENQYKTYFFEAIASKLKEEGHEIFWIIQNKLFAPKGDFNKFIIPYPQEKQYLKIDDEDIDNIIYSDRNINYFGKENESYFYYYNEQIKEIVYKIKPDIAFGESTLFHELLTGKHCKELGVKYLNPLPCRYPTGKFSFYLYDTLEPFKGCDENLPKDQVLDIINNITGRTIAPDYMKPVVITKVKKTKDKLKKIAGYYTGEKYNTPSPLAKLKIEKQKNVTIESWDSLATTKIKHKNKFKVLYPLQVQPEENIDVWGRKRRDQLAVIQEIESNLPENTVLYVKPNPKPKYEVDEKMIDFISSSEKISMVHHSVSMTDIFNEFDLIITVTGTVAIESILSNKPVVNLIETLNNTVKNCVYLENLKELPQIIDNIKNNTFPRATEQDKIDFVNLLNKTSYFGNVSDVFSDKNCINKDNVVLITKAFNDVMAKV